MLGLLSPKAVFTLRRPNACLGRIGVMILAFVISRTLRFSHFCYE
jgi:hypothetical protein